MRRGGGRRSEAAILTAAVWRSTPNTALVSSRTREVFVLPAFSSNSRVTPDRRKGREPLGAL
jgi:hypothetical protein